MKQHVTSFEIAVFYGTLVVWEPSHRENISYLEERQAPGFAWEAGNVNFDTFGECSHAFIEVCQADEVSLKLDTLRAILVPFSVVQSGVLVTSILFPKNEEVRVPIPEGSYALVFEMKLRDDEAYFNSSWYQYDLITSLRGVWCRLTFIPKESVEPEILREEVEPV